MEFEWNASKSDFNINKHGLDFADSHRIFDAPLLVLSDDRDDYGENRYIGLGLLDGRCVVLVYSEPDENVTRIISLRKALSHEKKRYEQYLKNELGAS